MPASPTDATSSSSSSARDRAATSTSSEAAATEASLPTEGTTTDAPTVPATGSAKSRTAAPPCPTCRGPLEKYRGEAAHKLGSFWCHVDGRRWHPHELGAAADEATAPASTTGTKAAGAG